MPVKIYRYLLLILLFTIPVFAQNYKVLESTSEYIKIEFNFLNSFTVRDTVIDNKNFNYISGKSNGVRAIGDPWLPGVVINLGIPNNSNPQISILNIEKSSYSNKFIIPVPENDPAVTKLDVSKLNERIYNSNNFFPLSVAQFNKPYTMRFARIVSLEVSPYQFNPVSRMLVFNKKIVLKINYNSKGLPGKNVHDTFTENFLKASVVNYDQALNWISKPFTGITLQKTASSYWYDPAKNYYKIFLKEKGIYRLTFEQLISAGIPISGGVPSSKLEILNEGEDIPIEIHDGGDGNFNSGDYIQFAGYPPKASPNCSQNIYNLDNVYWFSYESDTPPDTFRIIDGFPHLINKKIESTLYTVHYEKDSLYERLGYAADGNRDFWFWGGADGSNGVANDIFRVQLPAIKNRAADSNKIIIRTSLQGLTTYSDPKENHYAKVLINGKPVDAVKWSGLRYQTDIIHDTIFSAGINGIQLLSQNEFQVETDGSTQNNSDVLRINWFELEYRRQLKADQNNLIFESSYGVTGTSTYSITNWQQGNMKIYIPQRGEMILNPEIINDTSGTVLFNDNINEKTEYFCVSNDYFLSPDSIVKDIPSDLRNTVNGADYLIITYPDFLEAANKLAAYRSQHLEGYTDPRVKVVNVMNIYDEFSNGLLDPYAIKDFFKYAFDNWNGAPPAYVALMGDMSYDYRHLLSSSRKNYIPSIPYQQERYGQAVADNNFVAVSGNDVFPDAAIGRLSCETLDEANVLVNKIINYPADKGKQWKQNVLLIGGGSDASDENFFNFNGEELYLQNEFIIPQGYTTSKVFRYPVNAEQIPFKGEGPDIRQKIDSGCVIVNYYGHGGGYQWDLVFLNDDIYQLENSGRLPMIFSVTCYTAHFDNQDVFGEQFNKVPGKGAIGFWGHTGITFWDYGLAINDEVFHQIFTNKTYVVGDAILDAKSSFLFDASDPFTRDHIALLTLLGDPALELALPKQPDFSEKPEDIVFSPQYPASGQEVTVKLRLHNLGRVFPQDSVNVKLTVSSNDTSFVLKNIYRQSFGENDSVIFNWTPKLTGNINFRLEVNGDQKVPENDYSDNTASRSVYIFNLGQPDIVYPIDGFTTSKPNVSFLFSDVGEYIKQNVSYIIEIDTSLNFNSPQLVSTEVQPKDGTLKWQSPQLQNGYYFWRTRTKDSKGDTGSWSTTRSLSILSQPKIGYYTENKLLKSLETYNINYSNTKNSLELNKNVLPPRPADNKFLEDINVNYPVLDSVGLSCITSDGTYIYFAQISYYAAFYNHTGRSHIYKMGTGKNGTVKGELYGEIPNFYDIIRNQYCYYNGYIYVPFGEINKLLKVSPEQGLVDTVFIPSGLLRENLSNTGNTFYLSSDGKYVYSLSIVDSLGDRKYTLRTLEPENNWKKVGEDLVLSGTSYIGFTSFFVADGYLFAYENYESGFMRRYNLSNGSFEEEWFTRNPFQGFYSWCYDKVNNLVYASVFRSSGSYSPKITVYAGNYTDDAGTITTPLIGPALNWDKVTYEVDKNGSAGHTNMLVLGLDKNTKSLDTLYKNSNTDFSISSIDPRKYEYLKMKIILSDSANDPADLIWLKNVNVAYETPPEILLIDKNMSVASDSLEYGLSNSVSLKVQNIGNTKADSALIKLYLDNTEFYSTTVNIPADSFVNVNREFSSTNLAGGKYHKVSAAASLKETEFFTYNNSAEKSFFVIRDSVKPAVSVTFDGREIVNGDVVPYKPDILITLKDNNPLPLDTNLFIIYFNGDPFIYSNKDVNITLQPYPNSEMQIEWKPELPEGQNTLQIYAKDASGNLSDSAGLKLIFNVYKNPDLVNVFNYPNPFQNDTYFTFELHGMNVPEEFMIKIYTVAGRLIRDISIPSSELQIGFNKIYWNGRDQDGDRIANGVYFYKMISKSGGVVKSVISKLAKVN
ncbi:MAG: C25 family cysteine peptidase [Ignavibacteriaceae bacterium]